MDNGYGMIRSGFVTECSILDKILYNDYEDNITLNPTGRVFIERKNDIFKKQVKNGDRL